MPIIGTVSSSISLPIAFVAANSAVTSPAATTISVVMPTINNNDFAIYSMVSQTATHTPPSGVTLLNTYTSTNGRHSTYYKKLDGTESGTNQTFTLSSSLTASLAIVVYSSVNTTTPFDTGFVGANAQNNALSWSSLTTVTNNTRIVAVVNGIGGPAFTLPLPSSPTHTLRANPSNSTPTPKTAVTIGDYGLQTAGATSVATSTATGNPYWRTLTIALRPA
jgi:hypothetical protein